jgi:hypothetical protein
MHGGVEKCMENYVRRLEWESQSKRPGCTLEDRPDIKMDVK